MFYILLLNSALLIVILILVFTRDKQRMLLHQLEQIVRQQMKENREELNRSIREMRMEIQDTLHKNTIATGELQKQKFDMLVRQQELLIHSTEKNWMRCG